MAVTVTVLAGNAPGWVTVTPARSANGDGSVTTYLAGQRKATCVWAATAVDGIDVYHSTGAHIIVDVVGWLTPSAATTVGRIEMITPTRAFDSRTSTAFAAGEERVVSRPADIPSDAGAWLINLTAVNANAGYWSAWPATQAATPSSCLNIDANGQTRAAFATVPSSPDGIRIKGQNGGHIIVDVVGYITGPSARFSADGLFIPSTPTRLSDTRMFRTRLQAGERREISTSPGHAAAFVVVTAVNPNDRGHLTLAAAGAAPVSTSTLNVANTTVSNTAIVATSSRGVAVNSTVNTDLLVDVLGYITGAPAPAPLAPSGQILWGLNGANGEAAANEWFDIGYSTNGRPMRGYRFGNGPRHALIISHLHGDEWSGESIIGDLLARGPIAGWTLWLMPSANPDARAANTRYQHGVDMNRDFPADFIRSTTAHLSGCITTQTGPTALTLPESRALHAAITNGPFAQCELVLSHHDNYSWVAPQMGSGTVMRSLSTDYAVRTGLRTPGTGSSHPSSISWMHVPGGFETFAASLGKKSILVENKAGYSGACWQNTFGIQPAAVAVQPHYEALRLLLTDARLPH